MRYAWFGCDKSQARKTGFIEAPDVWAAVRQLRSEGYYTQGIGPVQGAWEIPGEALAEWEWEHCLQPVACVMPDLRALGARHLLGLVRRDRAGAQIRMEVVPEGLRVLKEDGKPCGTVDGKNPWPVSEEQARQEMQSLRSIRGARKGEFVAQVAGKGFRFRLEKGRNAVSLELVGAAEDAQAADRKREG